jgi:predicted metalloprotease
MWLSVPWNERQIQKRFGPEALAVIIAHEFGHHIQYMLYIDEQDRGGKLTDKEFELQADCLAGNWAYSAYYKGYIGADKWPNILAALEEMAGTRGGQTHGSGEQRKYWFSVGANNGNPSECATSGNPNAQ